MVLPQLQQPAHVDPRGGFMLFRKPRKSARETHRQRGAASPSPARPNRAPCDAALPPRPGPGGTERRGRAASAPGEAGKGAAPGLVAGRPREERPTGPSLAPRCFPGTDGQRLPCAEGLPGRGPFGDAAYAFSPVKRRGAEGGGGPPAAQQPERGASWKQNRLGVWARGRAGAGIGLRGILKRSEPAAQTVPPTPVGHSGGRPGGLAAEQGNPLFCCTSRPGEARGPSPCCRLRGGGQLSPGLCSDDPLRLSGCFFRRDSLRPRPETSRPDVPSRDASWAAPTPSLRTPSAHPGKRRRDRGMPPPGWREDVAEPSWKGHLGLARGQA
ncbi:collagen alpha-1(I) chain-like [Candoia aspera]|uniref:collagen alpha-1(I) chain-like n=1 Tax=Candoia aspera TaxID=51853 RepID=UPI002FD7D0F6